MKTRKQQIIFIIVALAGLTLGPALLIIKANRAVGTIKIRIPKTGTAVFYTIKDIEERVLRCADDFDLPEKVRNKSPTSTFAGLAGSAARTGINISNGEDILMWAFKAKLPFFRGLAALDRAMLKLQGDANSLESKSRVLCYRFEYLEGKELKEREALVQNLLAEALPKLKHHQKQIAEARKLYESDRPWIKLLYYLLLAIQIVGWGLYPLMMRRLIRNYREHRAARKKAQAK